VRIGWHVTNYSRRLIFHFTRARIESAQSSLCKFPSLLRLSMRSEYCLCR